MTRNLILKIDLDQDTQEPYEEGDWQIVSFNRHQNNYQNPAIYMRDPEYGVDYRPAHIGLHRKLSVGLAFWLRYRDHGPQCEWRVIQEVLPGYHPGGILLWSGDIDNLGAKTREDRLKDASRCMEVYTNWCNGDCWWYSLETEEGEEIHSCGGFIGHDHFLACLKDDLELYCKLGDRIVVEDSVGFCSSYLKLPAGVRVVDDFYTDAEDMAEEAGLSSETPYAIIHDALVDQGKIVV